MANCVLLTKPLEFQGKSLVLNAKAEGGITVEVLTENRQPIPGFGEASDMFRGDSVRHIVTWNGKSDSSALHGSRLPVRIRLKHGKLYSLGFQ
jgi:hypothetical protein